MKVLLGAYACVPSWGSEPGAGWCWAEAASTNHEVWVLTSAKHKHRVEAHLERFPAVGKRLHFVYVELPVGCRAMLNQRFGLLRYLVWQSAARRVAERLHAEIGFDVAHHVTWTVSWLPAAVTRVPGLPFVWGPVGGVGRVPRGMWRWLGPVGAMKELVRVLMVPVLRLLFARGPLRRANLVIAQSDAFARWARHRSPARVVIEPIVAIHDDVGTPGVARSEPDDGRGRVAVFAARLEAWKGLQPAIAALARPEASSWRLDVYGSGRQEGSARRLTERLGVTDRVQFLGKVPRQTLRQAIANADALVQPSFHDAPPFVVAEALSLGCPVVCLDVGGPAALVEEGQGVRVSALSDLPGALARGLQAAPVRFEPSTRWQAGRLPALLDQWYDAARTAGA